MSAPNTAKKKKRIRLMGLPNGQRHELSGQYVVSYDPDYHWSDGSYDGGRLICTPDREKATLFEHIAALELWQSGPQCECHRLRPDGKPNRPLSAFSVEIAP